MTEKERKPKVSMHELAGFLDGISWRILSVAVRYQDRELVEIYHKLQDFVDRAVFGERRT